MESITLKWKKKMVSGFSVIMYLGAVKNGFIQLLQFSLCCLQVLEEKMHSRLHLCTLLPTRGAPKIRQCAQNIWCKQCDKAPE